MVAIVALFVHGDEDGCSLEQLDLLVLGDEQLGRVLPLWRVVPTKLKVNAELNNNAGDDACNKQGIRHEW
jgi:hypothetical protein